MSDVSDDFSSAYLWLSGPWDLYIAHSWIGLDTNFLQGLQRWPLVGGAFCISQPSLSTLLPKLWFFLGSQTTETRNTYSTNIHLQKNWTCKTAKPLLSTQLRALLSICRRRCASWQLYRIRINPTECKNSKLQKNTGQSIARLRQALLCFKEPSDHFQLGFSLAQCSWLAKSHQPGRRLLRKALMLREEPTSTSSRASPERLAATGRNKAYLTLKSPWIGNWKWWKLVNIILFTIWPNINPFQSSKSYEGWS